MSPKEQLESLLKTYEDEISCMENHELTCLSGVLYFNRTILQDYEIYDRLLDVRNARVKQLGYTEADQNCEAQIEIQTNCLKRICSVAEQVTPAQVIGMLGGVENYEWWNGVTGGRP